MSISIEEVAALDCTGQAFLLSHHSAGVPLNLSSKSQRASAAETNANGTVVERGGQSASQRLG